MTAERCSICGQPAVHSALIVNTDDSSTKQFLCQAHAEEAGLPVTMDVQMRKMATDLNVPIEAVQFVCNTIRDRVIEKRLSDSGLALHAACAQVMAEGIHQAVKQRAHLRYRERAEFALSSWRIGRAEEVERIVNTMVDLGWLPNAGMSETDSFVEVFLDTQSGSV